MAWGTSREKEVPHARAREKEKKIIGRVKCSSVKWDDQEGNIDEGVKEKRGKIAARKLEAGCSGRQVWYCRVFSILLLFAFNNNFASCSCNKGRESQSKWSTKHPPCLWNSRRWRSHALTRSHSPTPSLSLCSSLVTLYWFAQFYIQLPGLPDPPELEGKFCLFQYVLGDKMRLFAQILRPGILCMKSPYLTTCLPLSPFSDIYICRHDVLICSPRKRTRAEGFPARSPAL
jgi:hypothetical protein